MAAVAIAPAQAHATSVSYVERSWSDGLVVSKTKTADAASLSSTPMQLESWYVVDSTAIYSSRPTVTGTANIILSDADQCTLYLLDGINVPEGATLNIYG